MRGIAAAGGGGSAARDTEVAASLRLRESLFWESIEVV